MSNQTAKADAGKPKLTLVPRQIIYDIAEVREYGNKKYGSPDNWKDVEIERYRDATFRHFMAYLENPQGVDEESGIKHLKHLACNIAFLCEKEKEKVDDIKPSSKTVELPCKVGDFMYIVDDFEGGVVEREVEKIEVFQKAIVLIGSDVRCPSCQFGKTVFFSQEEAEQALKGGAE